ncbi:MAG: flavodoxin domain-containing protein [Methanospirillum sp.]
MKTLIVYVSYHRMNTDRVDRAMAEATGATVVPVDEVVSEDLDAFELIGFGSGIYDGRHHGDLFALVGRMPAADRAVFVFSTSSGASPEHHRALKDALEAKWRRIAGEFQCRASTASCGSSLRAGATRTKRNRPTPAPSRRGSSLRKTPSHPAGR